ncbi:MAG: hypothetical protein IKO44_02930 [Ruminococcus sp.]|nr:hypothetical protein [Ruminococcus sp.]
MQTLKRKHPDGCGAMPVMLVSAVLGCVLGTLAYCLLCSENPAAPTALYKAMSAFGSLSSVYIDSFCTVSAFLLALFLLGFCSVAQPAEICVPAAFGLGSGMIMSDCYASSAFPGQAAYPALTAVFFAGSALCICAAACESVKMSSQLMAHVMSPVSSEGMLDRLRLYCGKFLAAELICAVLSGVRTLAEHLR